MVDLIDLMEPEYPKKGRKVLHTDTLTEDYSKKDGYIWTISPDMSIRELEIWRGPDGNSIYVRQEVTPSPQFPEGTVDLLCVTNGQAYDMLKALSRALEV